MSIAISEVKAKSDPAEQRLALPRVGYQTYEKINDALGENPGVRLIHVDGRLTFLTGSRRHDWYTERFAEFIKLVARKTGIDWEDSGSVTYRRRDQKVGVEGDKNCELVENAKQMRGAANIDLSTKPPPDLAIEVEVSHLAVNAMLVYGRIGVPEVWRSDVHASIVTFCLRNEQGAVLGSTDVLAQMHCADSLGASLWNTHLEELIVKTIVPRLAEG